MLQSSRASTRMTEDKSRIVNWLLTLFICKKRKINWISLLKRICIQSYVRANLEEFHIFTTHFRDFMNIKSRDLSLSTSVASKSVFQKKLGLARKSTEDMMKRVMVAIWEWLVYSCVFMARVLSLFGMSHCHSFDKSNVVEQQ